MEVPAERVVVVADGHHRVQDESARPPHLDAPGQLVAVLPEQPRVLLVDADRVSHDARRGPHGRRGARRGSGSRRHSRSPARASSCTRRDRIRRHRNTCARSGTDAALRRGRSSPHRTRGAARGGRRSARRAVRGPPADRWRARRVQRYQRTSLPSIAKLTPSGWEIANGRRSSRSGTTPAEKSPSASGIGLTSSSSSSSTRHSSRST